MLLYWKIMTITRYLHFPPFYTLFSSKGRHCIALDKFPFAVDVDPRPRLGREAHPSDPSRRSRLSNTRHIPRAPKDKVPINLVDRDIIIFPNNYSKGVEQINLEAKYFPYQQPCNCNRM